MAIHPTDVELLTGKGLRASQKLMEKIKKEIGKKRHQLLTIKEFCDYVGFNEELVRNTIL